MKGTSRSAKWTGSLGMVVGQVRCRVGARKQPTVSSIIFGTGQGLQKMQSIGRTGMGDGPLTRRVPKQSDCWVL